MSDLSALNLKEGDLVGGYTLISRLGSGAMGSVWRVRDDGGHQYAMKILRDSLAEDDESAPERDDQLTARERLRREAMALQKVRHPGVCGIVDMELDDALAFIVTELIEGRNLREDVRVNGRYVGDDLERLARKLIDAVKAVHAAGIVHRDIKPTNVMVSNTGPILVDFGIAMGEGESHVTHTGLVMGTPGFIAPEVIDGVESDETTDWWSVASVLAFAATGEPVFGTKPMMAVLERAAAGSANLSGLPMATMTAFRSALNPDRTKRCTPDELLHAIAMDAWNAHINPQSWDNNEGAAKDATEVMPPFAEFPADSGSSTDTTDSLEYEGSDNPRELWKALDGMTGEDAIGTRTLPQIAQTTRTLRSADGSDGSVGGSMSRSTDGTINPSTDGFTNRSIHGAASTDTDTFAETVSMPATATMPMRAMPPAPPTATTAMSALPQTKAMPLSTTRLATTRQTTPLATLPPTATASTATVPMPTASQPTALPASIPPASSPEEPESPGIEEATAEDDFEPRGAQQSNPADVRRGMLLHRGTLPTMMFAIPVALCGLFSPWMALCATMLFAWLLTTVGFNTESQLEREGRRGGVRRNTDWLLRVASLPWHLLKGFWHALMRSLVMLAVTALGLAIATVALDLPFALVDTQIFGLTVPLPTWLEEPLSQSGFTQACFSAVGWMVCAIAPGATIMRLGAGTLRRHASMRSAHA